VNSDLRGGRTVESSLEAEGDLSLDSGHAEMT
jgi:hypothetical protein